MSSAPSLQIVSLPTACLFYIASLCSLESGRLWVGWGPTPVGDWRWLISSLGHNGPVWGQSGFYRKKEASKIELPCGKRSVHQLQPFSFNQRKATSCPLSPKGAGKKQNVLFKGCDLIELDCVRAFTPEMISVVLSLCSAYCEAADNQIKNWR